MDQDEDDDDDGFDIIWLREFDGIIYQIENEKVYYTWRLMLSLHFTLNKLKNYF